MTIECPVLPPAKVAKYLCDAIPQGEHPNPHNEFVQVRLDVVHSAAALLEAAVPSPDCFKFEPATLPPSAFDRNVLIQMGMTPAQAKRHQQQLKATQCFMSDTYQVLLKTLVNGGRCLSIKRCDKEPIGDWREKQAIKSAILGPEEEAVELYPAESRLLDTANQYWLWAPPAGQRLPIGFQNGGGGGPEEAAAVGAKQRPFEEGDSDATGNG